MALFYNLSEHLLIEQTELCSINWEMASENVVNINIEESTTQMIVNLTSSIDHKLNILSADPLYSYTACIYRVSEKPRKANEAAYTPRLVSIGPLHHERRQLQGMEAYKLRCLQNFLIRFGVGLNNLVMFAAHEESYVRGCYEDTINLNPEQFSEMILLDGIFIVEAFCRVLLYLHSPALPREQPSSPAKKFEYTRSATELQEAGVKFRTGKGKCLFEVMFNKGELTVPRLIVNDSTETFFRNLIAFEQCGYYSKDITSYVILMDSLINTPNDVVLLVKRGIIKNELGESEQVADLFNNLYKEVMTETKDFYFAKLCGDLNDYSRDSFHEWKANCFKWRVMLRSDYFSNPWSFISVFAASILLLLTVTQTVCSIIQL
ncbi:hypothetical protein DH2020_005040 [Rehmannia glutinosa]|uniref:Uncharacterized protein n=1 Tax=Rehmannia glutinosa TaxID=99300 RepID=A0ABR0XR63_REHGL